MSSAVTGVSRSMASPSSPAEIDPRTWLVAKEMGPMFERAFTSTAERPGWTSKTVGAAGSELIGPPVGHATGPSRRRWHRPALAPPGTGTVCHSDGGAADSHAEISSTGEGTRQ